MYLLNAQHKRVQHDKMQIKMVHNHGHNHGWCGSRNAISLLVIMLFERSEFLIDTSQKKSLHACRVPCAVCTRAIILVLVCRIMYHIRTYLISARLPRYVHPTLRTSVTLVVCIRTRDLPTCPSKASVYEAKRIATSTTTTHTRDNKPFEAAAVQQRRCPTLLW